ncbi:MAG TPA: phenylalanine--tRNA ligase beta subunit-related protein [Candidatus Eisenbacteria bacterium]|jgi:DNA/RNA-binding domain of Phe-tRNA-synthetase-like protein|nr:phenylalanine--tRNA ligase beta subunit-related protein [Candidatus Eisenbacteria bacterium]
MPLQTRPLGLSLAIDEALRGVLALGLLEAEGLVMEPEPAGFAEERDRVCARLSAAYSGKPPSDVPGIGETRALFHTLGIDPTKTRPSSEALLRRVMQGRGLPTVNLAVDVCNLCSLEHQLPLGLYDRDLVHGGVRVRLGREGESYPGIRKQRVNLAGRLLLADQDGPFGAPTSDSARTAVTPRTRRLLVAVFCPIDRAEPDLAAALEAIAASLTRWCGATVTAVRVAQ